MQEIEAYHACSDLGGGKWVLSNAPFISEDNERQWLGQGFYFWYGDVGLAIDWGERSISTEEHSYAVFHVTLRFREGDLFDLVGEPAHIKLFESYATAYVESLRKSVNGMISYHDVSVRELMDFLRKQKGTFDFRFRATKVATKRTRGSRRFLKNRREELGSNPRQQICVFPEYKCAIFKKRLVEPVEWKSKFKGYLIWVNLKTALRHFATCWMR